MKSETVWFYTWLKISHMGIIGGRRQNYFLFSYDKIFCPYYELCLRGRYFILRLNIFFKNRLFLTFFTAHFFLQCVFKECLFLRHIFVVEPIKALRGVSLKPNPILWEIILKLLHIIIEFIQIKYIHWKQIVFCFFYSALFKLAFS